jgi:hypothetical protein
VDDAAGAARPQGRRHPVEVADVALKMTIERLASK